ncbi:MAG: DNA recombination protein RmuC [Thermacetogeniaceae bacterium]
MVTGLLILTLILNGATLLLLAWIWRRSPYERLVRLEGYLAALERGSAQVEQAFRDEFARSRTEASLTARQGRDEQGSTLNAFGESVSRRMTEIATLQKNQLDSFACQLTALTGATEQKLEQVRGTVEAKLTQLQAENSAKLEQMRATVDEKLSATLEQRLGESFKLVSERLEQVHKGLGEMQSLATGVGDLKKVLTNVKTRGVWGEIQLGAILDQILTGDQYACNVATRPGSTERVEFAIRLPGRDPDGREEVLLPIDAKFPQEDYQRMLDEYERGNPALAEEAAKQLETRIRLEAKSIKEKYLDPPHTTDFAIMFLPVEGLYAEVLRRPGLCEALQREHRVVITGPTTLAAILNSLQMGFRTLAIERRSSEVWSLLGAVKTEFGKFGDLLDKTHKKLEEAAATIDSASKKSRTIERRLKDVQALPAPDIAALLGEPPEPDND